MATPTTRTSVIQCRREDFGPRTVIAAGSPGGGCPGRRRRASGRGWTAPGRWARERREPGRRGPGAAGGRGRARSARRGPAAGLAPARDARRRLGRRVGRGPPAFTPPLAPQLSSGVVAYCAHVVSADVRGQDVPVLVVARGGQRGVVEQRQQVARRSPGPRAWGTSRRPAGRWAATIARTGAGSSTAGPPAWRSAAPRRSTGASRFSVGRATRARRGTSAASRLMSGAAAPSSSSSGWPDAMTASSFCRAGRALAQQARQPAGALGQRCPVRGGLGGHARPVAHQPLQVLRAGAPAPARSGWWSRRWRPAGRAGGPGCRSSAAPAPATGSAAAAPRSGPRRGRRWPCPASRTAPSPAGWWGCSRPRTGRSG